MAGRLTNNALVPERWVLRLAGIALGLPDAYQEEAWVGERWRVRGRTFGHVLMLMPGKPRPWVQAVGSRGPHAALIFRVDPDELEVMRRSGPRYFKAPWGHDVGGMVVDDDSDWTELWELLVESYCRLAPQKLVRLVDRPPPAVPPPGGPGR